MRILAVETATEACSAALYLDGETCERFEVAPRRHAQLILPMVTGLLAEAGLALGDLDALAFGRGPGAFTGLRVAAGVVQGLGFRADLPVAPVSTLAALAWQVFDQSDAGYALAALDARMGEIYWGVYRRDLGHAGWNESVIPPAKAPARLPAGARAIGIGPGWAVYGEVLRRRVEGGRLLEDWPHRLPRAGAVARLAAEEVVRGRAVAPEQALPVYLRNRVADPPLDAAGR